MDSTGEAAGAIAAPASQPAQAPQAPPHDAHRPSHDHKPSTAPAAAEAEAAAAALALIDGSGPETERRVPLRELQRACARLPLLSTLLTGERRYKLYVQVLLDEGEAPASIPIDTFSGAAAKATETHRAAAAQVMAAFPSGHFGSAAVVEGFLFWFAAQTSYNFSPEESGVLVTMADVVSSGKLATGEESLTMLYNLMVVVAKDFMSSNTSRLYDGATALLFRLILQYQDPALSAHLDQLKIAIGTLLLKLTRSLFVLHDTPDARAAALAVWDWIFVLGDPVLVPYIAVALLTAVRQSLLSLPDKASLEAALATFNVPLPHDRSKAMDPQLVDGRSIALVPVWAGKSLCQNADLLFRNTPQSAQRVLEFCLSPESGSINKTPQALEEYYAAAPVLPLERSDIASSFSTQANPLTPQLQYVIVDCRSQGSFDYARLPTALLIGDIVGYDQGKLAEVADRLRPSKGCHLSLFGTGRALVEEVNLLKLVALHLLRQSFPFVSITTGGFKSVIPLIRSESIHVVLNNGEPLPAGEQRSLLAGLPSKITELRDAYLPADAQEAKARAAELGEKASQWGWGLWSKAQERLTSAREAALAAVARASDSVSTATPASHAATHTAAPSAPTRNPTAAAATNANAAEPSPSATGGAPPLQGRVAPPPPAVQIFTLGDEDEDDDFDLITAVPPPKPMKGKVLTEAPSPTNVASAPAPPPQPQSEGEEERQNDTEPSTAAAGDTTGRAASPSAAQIAASIDKEFDDLFGS